MVIVTNDNESGRMVDITMDNNYNNREIIPDNDGVDEADRELQMRKRQLDFLNPIKHGSVPIHVIGCGGIGSYLVEVLVSMGFNNVTVYDTDVVELHNISCQNFDYKHIGTGKVYALHDKLQDKLGLKQPVQPVEKYVENKRGLSGIVVFAMDNIETRTSVYQSIVNGNRRHVDRIIDGRLGGEMYEIININLNRNEDRELYGEKLHSPKESESVSCTGKAIAYIGYEIAGQMARELKLSVVTPDKTTRYQMYNRADKHMDVNDNVVMY